MKKIIIICFFTMMISANAYALNKPACAVSADSYLTRQDGIGGIIIDYYNGISFLCSAQLSKSYFGITIERKPYTQIIKENTETYDEFTANLSKIISFFAGVLAMMGFILGVKGGRIG